MTFGLISPLVGSIATTACGCASPTYTVPSAPSAMPCGSPVSDQRRTIFGSLVGIALRTDCAWSETAADKVSSTIAAVRLLLECVGEVFDNSIREELLTHLTYLPFDFRSWLPTIRKR